MSFVFVTNITFLIREESASKVKVQSIKIPKFLTQSAFKTVEIMGVKGILIIENDAMNIWIGLWGLRCTKSYRVIFINF